MDIQEKLEKFELHNKKLIAHGQAPISFEQWDIGYNGAIVDHITTEQAKNDEVKKRYKNDSEIANLIREFGGFYFSSYKNVLKLKLDRQYLLRFAYLCTFMDYDNKLLWGKINEGIAEDGLAVEKDLQDILKLSQNETIRTKNELIKHKLIIINDDKTITINNKYAIKGKIDKRKLKGSVRTMEKGIQELYNKAKAIEHKKLGLLIELLPYLNFQHNVLCNNPEETDITKIDPLNLTEVMNIAQYKNLSRFKKDLLNLTVSDELVAKITETKHGKFVYINPRIFYKGNNVEDLKATINEFRIKKQ